VDLAKLEAGGTGFRFGKLPVGRFDWVLITKDSAAQAVTCEP
jgi:hypothetical protein